MTLPRMVLLGLLPAMVACRDDVPLDKTDSGALPVDTGSPDDTDTDTDTDTAALPVDADGDGYRSDVDCRDDDAAIHPGAIEVCNGVDDDCDDLVDDADDSRSPVGLQTFYEDADGDGFGVNGTGVDACVAPTGFAAVAGDCNDAVGTVYPGADEVCASGFDDDCDGTFGEACGIPSLAASTGDSDLTLAAAVDVADSSASNVRGTVFVTAFDLDGDGFDDALVGDALTADGSTRGAVHALWGSADSASPGGTQIALRGTTDAANIGATMAVIPDVTGDGRPELAVTGLYGVWFVEQGSVAQGGSAPDLDDVAFAKIDVEYFPATFPSDVVGTGDVDDDGLHELLVTESDRVFLFWGSELAAETELSNDLSTPTWGRASTCKNLLHKTVASEDLDGDGYADVSMGCGSDLQYGRVELYTGIDLVDQEGFVDSALCVHGWEAGDGLGSVVAPAGDLNHDGYPDLAASDADLNVYLMAGSATWPPADASACTAAVTATETLSKSVEATGEDLSSVSWIESTDDVTGDGIADLMVVSGKSSLGSGAVSFFAGGLDWDAVDERPIVSWTADTDLDTAAMVDLQATGVPSVVIPRIDPADGLTLSLLTPPGY